MLAGNRVCSPLSDAPKQTAWRCGSELERMQANMGEMGQYQTSELGAGGSNPSRCAIVCLCSPMIGQKRPSAKKLVVGNVDTQVQKLVVIRDTRRNEKAGR